MQVGKMIHRVELKYLLQSFYSTAVIAALCSDFCRLSSPSGGTRPWLIEAGTPPAGERALIVSGILVALGVLAFLLNAFRQKADIRRGLNDAGKQGKSS